MMTSVAGVSGGGSPAWFAVVSVVVVGGVA